MYNIFVRTHKLLITGGNFVKESLKKEKQSIIKPILKIASAIGIVYLCSTVPLRMADKIFNAQLNAQNNKK